MPRRTTTSAAATYAKRRTDIDRLINLLQTELAKHAEKAAAAPSNWGFAGDLDQVRSELIYTAAFMSGMERDEVVRFLEQAD